MSSAMYVAAVSRDRAAEMLRNPPSLGARPSATSIDALRKFFSDALATEPSRQSPDLGFSGMVEEDAIYALRSPGNPWIPTPNPGEHRPIDPELNTAGQNDATVQWACERGHFMSEQNIKAALAVAMNEAVDKAFRRLGRGAMVGNREYRPSDDIVASLRNLSQFYGRMSPQERTGMETNWSAPWNPGLVPIETYLATLEDVYVLSVRHPPSYTMDQMIQKAIDAITVTGLLPNHLLEWNGFDPANQNWDELRTHFGEGYGHLLLTNGSIPQRVGAANLAIEDGTIEAEDLHDDEEVSLSSVLGGLQSANSAAAQQTNSAIVALTQQVQALTTEMAQMRSAPAAPADVPSWAQPLLQTAYATQHAPPAAPTYAPAQPAPRQQGRGNGNGGRQGRHSERNWRRRMAQNANPPSQQN